MYYELYPRWNFDYGGLNLDGTPHRSSLVLAREDLSQLKHGIARLSYAHEFQDGRIAMPD